MRRLVTPVSPESFPKGMMTPLEIITNTSKPFRALCGLCGNEYKPRLSDIKRVPVGVSLTCGCVSGRVSRPVIEISNYLNSLGIKSELEYNVKDKHYDIFVPSSNLLIEYNGLRFHKGQRSAIRDFKKYMMAISMGFNYLMIFEDEWKDHKQEILTFLQSTIISEEPEIIKTNVSENEIIYQCLNNDLAVTIKSIRDSEWEILGNRKIPIICLRKIVRSFLHEFSPHSVTGFSDNRFSTEKEYSSLGFILTETISPRCYIVKGNKRSFLNNSLEYELTKLQENEKIWDLGHTKWTWKNSSLL